MEATTDHHGKVVDFDGVMRKKRLEIKWSERRDSNHVERGKPSTFNP